MPLSSLFKRPAITDTDVDRIAARLEKTFSLKNPGPLQQYAADLLGTPTTGVSKPYQQSIWVYRCINLWLRVAQIPWLLKDDKTGDDIEGGALDFLIKHPNSEQTTGNFIETLMLHLANWGKYFVLRDDGTNFAGVPHFLQPIDPRAVVLEKEGIDKQTGKVIFWTIKLKTGGKRKVDARGVITDKLPNPYHKYEGLSPLVALRLTVDSDFAARTHNKWMMQRHGRISNVVSFSEEVGEDKLKLRRDLWNETYADAENAGKTAFLDLGAKIQQLALSMKDLDWLQGQKISREEIAAAFGVPPPNAGILDKATYSNFEQSSKSLWEDTLIPLGNRVSQKFDQRLVDPAAPTQHLEFDFINSVAALQEDQKKKVERYTELVKGGKMTPTQAASLTQIDLGEPNPAHDVVWVGINELPASDVLAESTAPPPPEPVKTIEEPVEKPQQSKFEAGDLKAVVQDIATEKAVEKIMESLPWVHHEVELGIPGAETATEWGEGGSIEIDWRRNEDGTLKAALISGDGLATTPTVTQQGGANKAPSLSHQLRQARGRSILRAALPFERRLLSAMKRFFFRQRSVVMDNFEKTVRPHLSKKGFAEKILDKTPQEIVDALLAGKDWDAELLSATTKIVRAAGEVGAKQILAELNRPPTDFTQATLDSFIKQQAVLMEKINETTREALLAVTDDTIAAITEGLPISETMDAMADSMKDVFKNTEARRRSIARTESLRPLNGGRFAQMEAAGIAEKEWLTVRDANVRESHENLDGTTVAIGEVWITITGAKLMYPHDPSAPASETVMCRCTLIAVFK